jgi:outer membrane protein insertion porin family
MRLSLVIKKENEDLEKQVNKLNNFLVLQKNIIIALTILIFASFSKMKAQDKVPFDEGKKYILADVKLTTKISFNDQTVVTFAGLQKGQEITIPGEEISGAIKKLGKLGLFDEISFYINRIEGDSIHLDLDIKELPKLGDVKFVGVKKNKVEALIKDNSLTKGKVVNENLITTTKNHIENKYKKEGYYNTKVIINTPKDTSATNQVNMVVNIKKGDKIKIDEIDFVGNSKLSDNFLKGKMKETKERKITHIFKSSKFIKDKYKTDLEKVIEAYKEKGYRDARIVSDSVTYDKQKKALAIKVNVEEGNKYYFGNIKFLGNTVYSDQGLSRMLGIKKGDTYNGVLLEKRIADKTKPDGEDITNLYQNNGYLFSNINAVEVKTANDTIDFEIRVTEGPIAYFNKISVVGNDKTNDRVIYRELRTKPGEKYSKELLVRTVREIGQLGFFDPEAIDPKFKNVDSNAGTVDIEYHLAEKGASQIELQGGYGGGGFIGTLGLSFNNFSARNLFKKEAYHPLPMGDGQKVALRAQASINYQTYSLSFSEPWFGQKRPVQFSSSFSFTKQYGYGSSYASIDKTKYLNILSVSVGIAKRLSVPDDYFQLSQSLTYQHYDANNFAFLSFANGISRDLSYTIGLSRNNKGVNPIFPMYGSEFSISAKMTLPYSLLNGVNYGTLGDKEEYKLKSTVDRLNVPDANGNTVKIGDYIDANGNKVNDYTLAAANTDKVNATKFSWLEYYKVKMKADWYTKLYGKLVLRTLAEFGYLGAYNKDRGVIPFERFSLGGTGLQSYSGNSRESIQLRGYTDNSLVPVDSPQGAPIYNKFSMEMRYPITLKASASIYGLAFAEGGNSFASFGTYNPFDMKRSAGVGLRIFMPAFGLLGFDYAYGFDNVPGVTNASGWQPHFIIGQQF